MSLLKNLIMVGMRYQPYYAKANVRIGDILILKREPDNGVNTNAVAVFKPIPGIVLGHSERVGYIRDSDLWGLEGLLVDDNGRYKVTRICTNYLKLELVSHEKHPDRYHFYSSPEEDACLTAHVASASITGDCTVTGGWPIRSDIGPEIFYLNSTGRQFKDHANVEKELQDKIKAVTDKLTEPKEKKMINTNSMRDSFFKEVKNVALDFQSGKLGVTTKDGLITATDEGVSVNPITEMGFNVPAFAMRVPVDQLSKGDIIISSGDPVFFMEGNKTGYVTMTTSGVLQETGIVSNMFFGKNTVMAVKNMFGDTGAGGMNPMMLMMMMGDDKGSSDGIDFKKLMLMQMMMGGQSGMGEGMNPLMMMAMMGKL